MKVLVTGAAGFIASHLVLRLLNEGCNVVALDKYSDEKIFAFYNKKKYKNLQIVKEDITRLDKSRLSFFGSIDWVFHLAGLLDTKMSVKHPLLYHQVNVNGTLFLLEIARNTGVKKFIYTASASCYGRTQVLPTPETAPINLGSPHALTKYLGEAYTLHYGQVYKLPVVSLRIFNVYGPSVNGDQIYGPIITEFIFRKLADRPYLIFGDGEQRRDFVYISDVVDAFLLAARSKITNEVFNVGYSKSYSLNQLVKLLGGKAIYRGKERHVEDDTCADISKINKLLGWQPKVSLPEGINNTIQSISNIDG